LGFLVEPGVGWWVEVWLEVGGWVGLVVVEIAVVVVGVGGVEGGVVLVPLVGVGGRWVGGVVGHGVRVWWLEVVLVVMVGLVDV